MRFDLKIQGVRLGFLLILAGWTFLPVPCVAQAFVEQVSPPVVQRGTSARIRINGTEVEHVTGLWNSLAASLVEATPIDAGDGASVEFEVRVAPDAPLGIYGLRLATESGLSNVHLFLIDDMPVQSIVIPETDMTQPLQVMLPACLTAACRPAAVDRYQIQVKAGQSVTFEVIGNRFGKDYDPLVRVLTLAGELIAEGDNSGGLFFDCRFSHVFAEAGNYLVEVRDSRFSGSEYWNYVLRMGSFPVARMAVPSSVRPGVDTTLRFPQIPTAAVSIRTNVPRGSFFQEIRLPGSDASSWIPVVSTDLEASVEIGPNHTPETATPVAVPGMFCGVLSEPGERDFFAFNMPQGSRITVKGIATQLGSSADLELILYNQDGREASRVDDVGLEEGRFTFNANGPGGLHKLMVRDLTRGGGPEFAYRIEVRWVEPEISLVSEVARITLPQGNYQPIPLKVTRQNFAGEVKLELVGAPTGVKLEPDVIPADANEFVCKLTGDSSAALGLATLQILATGRPEGSSPISCVAQTAPLIDKRIIDKDRIVYALREDQRNPPPSMTDRIALLVTPPAPFDFEIPELLVRLPRYQTADFRLETTRQPGFVAPLTFAAKGGQIGDEAEERNQLFVRYTPATSEFPVATGTLYTRILTGLAKHRVDISTTGEYEGHKVTLNRTFQLDVTSAFSPTFEPETVKLLAGETAKVTVAANRLPTFDGAVKVEFFPNGNFQHPEFVEIPAGKESVEFEVTAKPDQRPGRQQIRIQNRGFVGKYEEELNGPNLTLEVLQPPKTP